MALPLVSFLVPTYNYARYLPFCLDSILALEGSGDFEIVVVDDASTDDTTDVLERYNDPRIRVLRNERNQGHARTIQILLREARGKLVARIDPDDRYRPDFLTRTLPVFRQDPEVGLVYGDAVMIDPQGNALGLCEQRHQGQPFSGNELVDLLGSNFICAPTVIARRECWLDALPVPEHLAFNDWYFTIMIARRWKFHYLPHVLAEYRIHPTQHHNRVAIDGTEERSIRWLLDHVYSSAEADPVVEQRKRQARDHVYALHQLDAGEKYFGAGKYDEARRCYLAALQLSPGDALRVRYLRHLGATLLGRSTYERIKSRLKRMVRA